VHFESQRLLADYTKSIMEVFRDAASFLVQENQTFELLSNFDHGSPKSPPVAEHWPSWVPRWQDGTPSPLILKSKRLGYAASADLPLASRALPVDNLDVLPLTGVDCSSVKNLGYHDRNILKTGDWTSRQFMHIWEAWIYVSRHTIPLLADNVHQELFVDIP
jgi:hypothetical protein